MIFSASYYIFATAMFRWVSTILLLLIILLQIAGKWLILADYAINKDFIARTLCINKAKPAMHCNGKCHLRKQLQKEENGGSQEQNKHQKFQEVFFDTPATFLFEKIAVITGETPTANTSLYNRLYACSIFHPPAV